MNLRQFFSISNWWGKVLGGFFGYLMAGSAGAVFGVLIGNFFDRGFAFHFANPHLSYHMEKRKAVQKIFFESTFSVMGHIAKSDGLVTKQELEIARLLMHEMRLNNDQKTQAKKLFNQGKQADFDLNATLHQLKNACKDNLELLKLFVDIQYRAARVDGLTNQKILGLNKILAGLGFAPLHKQYRFQEDFNFNPFEYEQKQRQKQQSYQQSSSSYQKASYQSTNSTLDHAFALLEIPPNASKQEVKRAYRKLMSRNHPDKLTSQGLPPEMIQLATDKTQKILKAYEMICKTKGW